MFGTQDLVIALVLGAFFFGAKRLPEIARSLGKSMQEFKKGVAGETVETESPMPPEPATCGDRDRVADVRGLPEAVRV